MKDFLRNSWKHRAHIVMALPVFLILLFFSYVPMAGLVMAFKSFDYTLGIWKSPWNGIENFKFLLASKSTFLSITKNTLMYYVIFTALGTFLNVVLAIAIDQFLFKKAAKVMQTIMIVPVFISYAAVQFIVYAFISTDTGILNNALGMNLRFYSTPSYWPVILTVVKMWNSVGYGSVLYMSVLSGIDTSLYEAAEIDGANKWQRIWYITLPELIPMITVMLLLSVGNIMRSDTGLFYQVTRNSGVLYSTTQVIDSYVLNAIFKNSNFGFTAATSFFQSIVGLLLMLFANGVVRRLSPDDALF
ncbi:MAG TPA: ABC transporter permease subunit [Candidatus Eisenbergiella stercoravium]|nr:ABC transporter permease subunit [Candidatus Eisenbergiella stercoravium]